MLDGKRSIKNYVSCGFSVERTSTELGKKIHVTAMVWINGYLAVKLAVNRDLNIADV